MNSLILIKMLCPNTKLQFGKLNQIIVYVLDQITCFLLSTELNGSSMDANNALTVISGPKWANSQFLFFF